MNNKIGMVYSHLGELITDLEEALLESEEKNRTLCGELADSELSIENQTLRKEISRLQKLNDGLRSQIVRVTTERDQLLHVVTTPVAYTTPADDDIKPNWHFVKREGMPKEDGEHLVAIEKDSQGRPYVTTSFIVNGHCTDEIFGLKNIIAWAEMPSFPKEV